MKTLKVLLGVSVSANLALAGLFIRPATTNSSSRAETNQVIEKTSASPSRSPVAGVVTPTTDGNLTLRDRLRTLGFAEDEVRSALRARIEAARLARQREALRAATARPWWQVTLSHWGPLLDPLDGNREWREMRKAERAELVRLFGPVGGVTREELELYAFLPEEKAARFAALERDYRELRHEIPRGAGAPRSPAETAEREKIILAAHERDRAALLSPEERIKFERHTSIAAYTVADRAKYFSATEAEYDQLLELTKAHRAASGMDRPSGYGPGRLQASIEATNTFVEAAVALLGPERFQQWERSGHDDYRALMELQRRFNPPADVINALSALPRQTGEEGMAIARDSSKMAADQAVVAPVQEVGKRAREKILALLGPDLGAAYAEAAARGWLDQFDRGMVPFFQDNGQRAVFMAGRRSLNLNAPPPRRATPSRK